MNRTAWGLAALAIGTAFGAAIGFENTAAMVALSLALIAVFALVTVASLGRSPARAPTEAGGGAQAPVVRAVIVETNDPIRRALAAGTILTMFIVAADTQGYTLGRPSGIRYLLLLVPLFALLLGAAVADRSRLAPTTTADRFLLVYALCGVVGSVYGRAFLHTPDSGTVIFLPMCLGLAHLLIRDPLIAREAERFQRNLVRVCIVFLVFGILSETPLWPLQMPVHSAFERSYFVAFGLSAALFSRKYGVAVLIVLLTSLMFLQYPAATWIIVSVSAFATCFATSRRGRRGGALVMLVFAIGVLGFGFSQVQGGQSSIAKSYFSSVGKTNNTKARTALWKTAEIEIRKSPLFGSKFAGNFTLPNVDRAITNRAASARVEPHNDYLEALILGGFFGLFLFGAFIISTNIIVIRRVRLLTDAGALPQANLARILLIGFNGALAAAVFNPELSKPGTTAALFLVYAVMMTIHPSAPKPNDISAVGRVDRLPDAPSEHLDADDLGAEYQARVLFGSEPRPPS